MTNLNLNDLAWLRSSSKSGRGLKITLVTGSLLACLSLSAVMTAQSQPETVNDLAEHTTHHALTATVTQDVFCSFLPPKPGGNIADSEGDAVVFCNKPSSQAPNANIFPKGFIKTAHFAKGSGFVQVTGTINRDAYRLSANDGGGQYDSNGAPPGARVTGAKKFVNLVEPDNQDFCIRACTNPSKCNTGESTKGCKVVVPGDYN
jgi:hypothetical protein